MDRKPFRDPSIRETLRMKSPNFSHVFETQFMNVAAFTRRVVTVVFVRAEEQVRRVHARADVAVVQHAHPLWNRTVRQLVRVTMRVLVAERSRHVLLVVAPSDCAVSVRHELTAPQPTFVIAAAINALPETFSHWLNPVRHRQILSLIPEVLHG
jgi:hypothetical protein